MFHKKFILPIVGVLLIILIFLLFKTVDVKEIIYGPTPETDSASNINCTDITNIQVQRFKSENYEDIIDGCYSKHGINILYPQFLQESEKIPEAQLFKLNDLIKKEALNILSVYQGNENNLSLNIEYEIPLKTDAFLSIIFRGEGHVEGGNHGNRHFYTLNIDLRTITKVNLKDVISNTFVLGETIKNKNFYFKMYDDPNSETIYQINDFVVFDKITDCDYGDEMYSYFTENSLGISFSVPYAVGNHREIEISYDELNDAGIFWCR